MYSINERFRIIYKESGLSQEKFADKIKRSRGEVANIIYDKTVPKDKIIEATCEAFDIQEDWLRYGLEPMRAAKSREEEIADLVGSALSGSSDFKKAVIKMICSRTDEELKALEAALLAVYEGIKKDQG
jgi:transcriptional regulator with XRE-family HTH domain